MRKLTEGFEPVNLLADEIAEHIRAGHAFTPAVLKRSDDGTYRRNNDAFGTAETVWLDIDNTVLMPNRKKRVRKPDEGYIAWSDFIRDPFLRNYALLAYTTFSHSEDHNKFRVVFQLPGAVDDAQEYKRIINAFIRKYDADLHCSDECRAFFGNTNALIERWDKRITDLALEHILSFAANVEEEERSYTNAGTGEQVTEDTVRSMLSVIPPQNDYMDWVRIIGAIASQFDAHTTVRLVEEWSPGYPGEVAYKVQHRLQRVQFGTLVYYAKLNGWEPPRGFYRPREEERQQQRNYMNTDLGNAERFADQYRDKVRFEHKAGQWYIWDGKRFKLDDTGHIYTLAKTSVRSIYKEAQDIESEDKRKAKSSWAAKSESRQRMANMLALASTEAGIAVTTEHFDRDPMQLNLRTGVLNLTDFHIHHHTPGFQITQLADVEYSDDAECPKWLEFQRTIFAGADVEAMMSFIQRAVGYSLSGLTSEQCLFFCYGSGSNGKSVFFDVMKMLFGDYYQKAPTEMLLLRRQEGIPNDIARLRGARLVVAAELPENKKFNESRIKDLTGEDRIVARFLHGEFFEFDPTHKLWLYGNHKPIITGTDHGIWRRINLIPFTVTIPEEKKRPREELMAEFRAELPGILRWAIGGYSEWKESGLQRPRSVSEATEEFRAEMDVLGPFIDEYIEEARTYSVQFSDVYQAYTHWAQQNGEYALPLRRFNQRMRDRGYSGEQLAGKYYHWMNIKLKKHGYNNTSGGVRQSDSDPAAF